MSKFEDLLFDYINSIARYTKIQPLNLGGYSTYSGGTGGPPGGYIGELPQNKVTFDLSEAEVYPIPSGPTLVDNLNRIRYRINSLEESTAFAGLTVKGNDVIVASGITILNFNGNATVEDAGGNQINITVLTSVSGTGIDNYTASGVYNEDLTGQIGASATHFDVLRTISPNTLRLYYNGLREYNDYTIDPDSLGFTTGFTVVSGDTLFIDYDTLVLENITVPSGVTLGYLEANYYDKTEVDGLVAYKSNIGHTHTESEITDLDHDANKIKGITVSSAVPIDGQILQYNASLNAWIPTTSGIGGSPTIHQQYIFTLGPDVNNDLVDVLSYRIYAHDIELSATITEVYCGLNTVPASGSSIQVNVLKNGSTIFNAPAYVQIDGGNYTASRTTNFATTTFNKNDYFQVQLVQGDSNAQYLTVHLRFDWEA